MSTARKRQTITGVSAPERRHTILIRGSKLRGFWVVVSLKTPPGVFEVPAELGVFSDVSVFSEAVVSVISDEALGIFVSRKAT